MKFSNALIIVFIIGCCSVAMAQYVAQSLQQRIQNDQQAIASDNADMQAKQADIQSINSDKQINAIVNEIQPVTTQQVVVGP